MSWIERIKNGMRITTGDGRQWTPHYVNAAFQQEFHYTELHFIEVGGSYVDRRQPLGTKYKIEIYFDGENHIETAQAFHQSSKDRRPWIIEHPLYDRLVVQPTVLDYDNAESILNTSKITGTVIETLEDVPISNLFKATPDDIPQLITTLAETAAESVTEVPTPTDVNRLLEDNYQAYQKGIPIISDQLDFTTYNNAYNTAATFINTATATPVLMMQQVIAALKMPGQFNATVNQRLNVLLTTFDNLRSNLFGLVSLGAKQLFAAEQAACISGMCQAAATPIANDYLTMESVLEVMDKLSGRYAQFVADLDGLQSVNAGTTGNYVVDYDMIFALSQLVNITIGNLYTIALGAKVERTIICEKDTNIILLAHRYLGIKNGDTSAIDQLCDINDISLDEYLQIPKGRKIKFYI